MDEVTDEPLEIVQRVAAVDIGKTGVTVCVRVPHEDKAGRRRQEVREYSTLTGSLLELADWLRCERVERVGMEATSDYWKPVFYLLEAEGFECWLLNARHVKNAPGRPKTDKLDAVWLAKVVEKGMCVPSFVPPRPIRRLRDVTRYRRNLIRERTREKQRCEKLLEDAQIKLSTVTSDLLGVSGRLILEALIAGHRNPRELAELARGRLRSKIDVLTEALTGHFEDHHGFLVRMMLDRIDDLTTRIGQLTARVEEMIAPFAHQVTQLDEVTGIGSICAQELIAEIGVTMTVFPTHPHLVSWAKFAPIDKQSAGRHKQATTGKGNPYLAGTLGDIVAVIARTHTFLGERYRRIAKRRGKRRAIVAVGNSVLTIVWHLLADPEARYHDLGADFYQTKINKRRRERELTRQLEQLTGQKVTLQPKPEQPAA